MVFGLGNAHDKEEKFLKALKKGDLAFIRKAVERHPDWLGKEFAYTPDKKGSPLHAAAYYDYRDIVMYLVRLHPSSINQTNKFGSTALHHACSNDSISSAQALLELGADPWIKNQQDEIPSDWCKSAAMREVFRDVLTAQEKAKKEKQDHEEDRKEHQREENARQEALIKQERQDFIAAISAGDLDKVKAALKAHPAWLEEQFDTYAQGKMGTPLHAAAHFNRPGIILYLAKEKKLPLNQKNGAQNTPLHHACMNGATDAARVLLELGADPWLKNKNGNTPVSEATTEDMKRIFESVIEERDRKAQEDKEAREWTLVSPAEVMRVRNLPDKSYRLTDIFNFSTRRWSSLAKDIKDGHVTQSNMFFDDIPDKEILQQAYRHLVRLKGKADPESIDRRPMDKPSPGRI